MQVLYVSLDGKAKMEQWMSNNDENVKVFKIQSAKETVVKNFDHRRVTASINQHAIVAITDVSGRVSYVNDMFCKLSGYDKEELIGQDHRIINSGFHDTMFFKKLWKTIASGKTWHGAICNMAKDGSRYWVQTTIVPFKNKLGNIEEYISIRTDITETVEMRERLERSRERAEDLNNKLEAERLALNNKNLALNEIIEHIERQKEQTKVTIKQNMEM